MTDMNTGKTLLVLAIVLGCFAVLWPKIFSPMMFENYNKIKPDRLPRPGPEFGHPALRGDRGRPVFPGEEGRTLRRTIDKELKPGPVPGMRPSMGGPGVQPQAAQRSQGGSMGILMPLYTIGIVIFFVYTVLKIIFKKKDENEEYDQQSKLAQQYARLDPSALNSAMDENKHFQKARQPHTAESNILASSQVLQPKVFQPEIPVKASDAFNKYKRIEDIPEEKPKTVKAPLDSRDEEILLLKQRLEETERAMKLIFDQISKTTPPVTATNATEKTSTPTPKCDADDENVTNDEENSSTESVDAAITSETTTLTTSKKTRHSKELSSNDDDGEDENDDSSSVEMNQEEIEDSNEMPVKVEEVSSRGMEVVS